MMYKILNKKTGLYLKGGKDNKFTKYGKTWNSLQHLKRALIFKFLEYPAKNKKISVQELKEKTENMVIEEYSAIGFVTEYALFPFIMGVVIEESNSWFLCSKCFNVVWYRFFDKENNICNDCKKED